MELAQDLFALYSCLGFIARKLIGTASRVLAVTLLCSKVYLVRIRRQ